jgi:predicted CoA-binding protein
VSKKEGISALYCGKEKKIHTYLFRKDKGWTMASAQRWVNEHKGVDMEDVELNSEEMDDLEDGLVTKFVSSPRNKYGTHSSRGFKGDYASAWKCHFSKVGGGSTSAEAGGPIRGTVRRVSMIAAGMKPPCKLVETDSVGARQGPKSPLKCTFPQHPSDYGLTSWADPSDDDLTREDIQLTCPDLNVIKKAALAEVKRRADDREASEEGKYISQDELADELNYLKTCLSGVGLSEEAETEAWEVVREITEQAGDKMPVDIMQKVGAVLSAKNKSSLKEAQRLIQTVIDSAEVTPEHESATADIAELVVAELVRRFPVSDMTV